MPLTTHGIHCISYSIPWKAGYSARGWNKMYRRFMTLIDHRRSLVTLSGHHDTTHLLILGRECWSGFTLSLSAMRTASALFLFAIVWLLHIFRSMLFVFIHGAWSHWRRNSRARFGRLELSVQTACSWGTGRGVMERCTASAMWLFVDAS